jgi:hypothetical protein
MKIKLKKLFISLLPMVCLLLQNHTSAMDDETNRKMELERLRASSLMTDSLVVSQADLAKYLNPVQIQDLISKSSLQSSSISQSSTQKLTPEEREYLRLQKLKDAYLFPPFSYQELLHLVGNILYTKYAPFCHNQKLIESAIFYTSQLNINDLKQFLIKHEKDINTISSAEDIILITKMVTEHSPPFPYINPYYGHQPQPFTIFTQPLIFSCATIKFNQISVSFDKFVQANNPPFVNNFGGPMGGVMGPMAGMPNQMNVEGNNQSPFIAELSKAINYPNSDYKFDLGRDCETINHTVQNWFNIVRKLALFELQQWEPLQVGLDQLLDHYTYIDTQLQQAAEKKAFFSGVAKLPQGFALIEVSSAKNAEEVEFLKAKVAEYKKDDAQKIEEYKKIKEELPYLRKLVNWIDDVFSEVRKRGRAT